MNAKIVMCGCAEVGLNMLEYLFSKGVRIDHFVSLTKTQARKNNVSGYVSFEKFAKRYNVPIYYPQRYSLKDSSDLNFFKKHKFDLLIIGGWQRLIPLQVLRQLKIGGLGIHGSSEFLPKGRGRSPINLSLIEGKKRFIIHLFLMTPGTDRGNIIDFDIFDINEWDTCRTVYYKNSIVSKRLLAKNIPRLLSGEVSSLPQKGKPTYYPKRTPDDGNIDWTKSVFAIYNFIRALTKPYPGAFSYLRGKKVFFWSAQPFDTRITYRGKARKGEVVEVFNTGDFVVNCNSGLLLVTHCNKKVRKGDVFSPVR